MPLNPTALWLVVGTVLCLVEVVLPTAFVACVMGISAFVVAALSGWLPFNLQVLLWMALSLLLVWLSRRLVPRKVAQRLDATEAETLTEILPGKAGRVLYEGNSWAARCNDEELAIAPHQKVYVVGRKGTTLIVMPDGEFHLREG